MKKMLYAEPDCEMILFEAEDIIMTSQADNNVDADE